jgi:hypothetical protein
MDNNPKRIIAREAKSSLKLKAHKFKKIKKLLKIWFYLSKPKSRTLFSSLPLPDERQEKIVNTKLKGYV